MVVLGSILGWLASVWLLFIWTTRNSLHIYDSLGLDCIRLGSALDIYSHLHLTSISHLEYIWIITLIHDATVGFNSETTRRQWCRQLSNFDALPGTSYPSNTTSSPHALPIQIDISGRATQRPNTNVSRLSCALPCLRACSRLPLVVALSLMRAPRSRRKVPSRTGHGVAC